MMPAIPLVCPCADAFEPLRKPQRIVFQNARSAGCHWLMAVALLLMLFAGQARAQYTVVDSGSSQTFTAPVQNAVAWVWTLDGSSVGTNSGSFTYSPDVNAVGTHDLIVYQTLATGTTTASEWGVRVRIPLPASAIQFYVSTTGSDTNNGSIGTPFRTLEAAQNAIRGLARPLQAGGVTVFLRSGTYFRTSSLVLSNSDSGSSASAPVVYTSYPGETAVLNGGKAVLSSQWTQLAASEWSRLAPGVSGSQIWEADITALGLTHKGPFPSTFSEWPIYNANGSGSGGLCELFYSGTRMWLSRYPNHNLADESQTTNLAMNGVVPDITGTAYLNTSGTYTTSSGSTVAVGGAFKYKTADASHVTRWQTALAKGGLWVDGYWRVPWQINGAKVLAIDTGSNVIMFDPSVSIAGGIGNKYTRPQGNLAEPYWVVNLLEEMDQAGEWAIDFSRNKLYFMMPAAGVPPADNSVVVTDMSTPIFQITGSNIVLKSLTIEDSLAQGVQILGGSRNLVTSCTFRNIGNAAVDMNNSSGGTFNGVVGCDMLHLGSAGVLASGGSDATSPRVPANDYVVNNNIQTFAEVVRVYAASVNIGYSGHAVGMRVAHNTASGSPHVGMLWGGYDHTFEYNDVSKYCQFSDDMGGIYTYHSNYVTNTVIRYNYFHDSPHGEGNYFDSDHINATVYGNVANLHTLPSEGRGYGFYDQFPSGTYSGMPITDTYYNNVAVNCHYGFQFYSGTGGIIESNCAYNNVSTSGFNWNLITTSGTTQSSSGSYPSVLASGSNTAYTSEPGFMDFVHDDLRLRPDSRVFSDMPDFLQIPFEMAGIYNDEARSNAPGHSPFITSAPPSPAPGASFTINGNLAYPQFDGGTTVMAYWGTVDSGTSAGWQNVVNCGTQGAGLVSAPLGGLSTSGTYYYRFYASNAYGSAWAPTSVTVTPPPTVAPTGVTALAGDSKVVLSWNTVSYATSYNVKRSTASGTGYVTLASITGTAYTDSSATNGTGYYYVVSAASIIAETPNSAEVSALPLSIPASWVSQDLGSTAYIGSSSIDPYGKFTLVGSGSDIWNGTDACQFAGQAWNGDGVLVARILDFTNTSSYTKVGVMFRETLLSNAKNVYAGADGQSTWVMQKRTSTGGSTANSGSTTSGALQRWIKLVRSGSTFTAYQSGTASPAWTAFGSAATVSMATNCYAGLAVSAHNNAKICTAHFDNVIFLATPAFVTGTNRATLTWLPSPGADSYLVQRSTVSGSNYTTVATLSGTTTYTNTGLTPGSTYYYVITAVADQGMTATSPQVTVQPNTLNAPTSLAAVPGYSQASLSWNTATGAVSYNIKRSLTSGSGYVTVASVSGTSYVDPAVTNGNTYYYVVSAVSSWGAESANSPEATVGVGPLQNTGFEAPALTSGTYSYNTAGGSWTFSAQSSNNGSGISSNASGFTKYNASAPQGQQVAFLQGTGSFLQAVNGLIPGAAYTLTFAASERHTSAGATQNQTFKVYLDSVSLQTFAPGATGSGTTALLTGSTYTDYSVSLTATAATQTLKFAGTNTNTGDNTVFIDNVRFVLQAPAAPTGLAVTSDFGQLTVTWNAVSGAASYTVKRSLNKNSGYAPIVTGLTSVTSYDDPIEAGATVYYYKVSAVNPAGESANSVAGAAPAINVPGPVVVAEATAPAGASVTFTTSATDLNGAALSTVDAPASGSVFPLGDTPVVTSATDAAGSSATTGFTVTVADTTPPAITGQGDLIVEATGSAGAIVNYAPIASDLVSGSVTAVCDPLSGSLFGFGTNSVVVTATDDAGNSGTSTFTVTVVDTTPPDITLPANMFVEATSGSGAVVSFTTSAVDLVSGTVPTTNSIASGTTFPIGVTPVYVTATDALGNTATESCNVTVLPLPITKADNNIVLSQTNSWVGGKTPGTQDIALWSGTYASASATATVGTGLTAEKIRIASISRAITIGAATGSLNLAGISGTGIDMSAATQDLTIASAVMLGSGSSQAWAVASGRTVTVSGAIGESVAGSGITASGSGTLVLSGSNTFTGGLSVTPPAGGLSVYKFGGNNPSAYVKLNGGAIGPITANGRLDLLNATTIGTISGSGSTGFVCNSSTANNILTFQGGSSFSMFYFGVDGNKATLQQSGSGAVAFAFFGYSPSNNTPNASIIFNGGTWNLGQTGQNNSNSEMTGTAALTNGASVTQTSSCTFTHGNWVVNSGTLNLPGGTVQHLDGKIANLSFTIGSGSGAGLLSIPSGGLILGNNNTSLLSLNDFLNVSGGGSVILGGTSNPGNLQLGTANNQTAETDTVTVSGGELVVSGSILALSGSNQTRVFNWTGGQLSAYAIASGSNFAASSGTYGGITQGGLNQTGGVLAPGDIGTAGETIISGSYTAGAASAFAIEIGGTSQASGFQYGQYDYVFVSGSTAFAGTLLVSLINNFVPTSGQKFTVLTSTSGLSAPLANLTSGTRVITGDGSGSFLVSATGNALTLSNYAAIAPPVITAPPVSGTVTQGTPFTLTVSASASAITPNTYQWRLNSIPIPAATGSSYTIAAAQGADAGSYDVVVANSAGSVTSSAATLIVLVPPTGLNAVAGNAKVTLTWNLSPGATSYKVKRGTSSGVYGSVFSNVLTNSYLDSAVANATTYYYVITAANGTVESGASTEVIARPAIPFGASETFAPKVTLSGSNLKATLPTVTGRTYQLQRSDTMLPNSWSNIGSPVIGAGASTDLQDPAATGVPRRFYRVQITQ